ncbi:MAG: YgjV family protein [Clostridia bacterium]|nr:YgjV family protein [Clostridia bacterium]
MNPILLQTGGTMDILAQAIGVIAVAISCVVFLGRKRRTILLCKFTTDVLWFWHYFLIGAYSGAALNILALFRESIFMNKGKKWASHKFWLFLILSLTILSCLLTWEGPASLLPMIGSCAAVVSFWCTKPINIRLTAIPSQVLWLVYGTIHFSLPSFICNTMGLITIGIGLYQDVKENKK